MQNKADVKIDKMNIRIATIKDYDNEQRTTNNEPYSKQTQFKANLSLPKGEQSQFLISELIIDYLLLLLCVLCDYIYPMCPLGVKISVNSCEFVAKFSAISAIN